MITVTSIRGEGLKGLKGIVQVAKGLVTSGYLHTLRRSRRSRGSSPGHVEGGEAEPDWNQLGGLGAAPAPPRRPAAPRAPLPRPDPLADQGARRQPAQRVAIT